MTKLTAVLKASAGDTPPTPVGFNGSTPCTRCSRNSPTTETALKASSVDPAVTLAAEQAGPAEVALSLYGDPDRRETERRRRRANAALEQAGLRPGPW